LIGYSRACDSYEDFLDIWLLITGKLLNQDGEEFEDTKGVIRIHKSKNTMPKRKRTIKDLQNIHIKLRTPHKTGGELRCSGRVDSSRSTSGTRTVLI
jgi:hypothetical protein